MNTSAILLTLALAHSLAVISPGPSLVVVARTAALHSRRAALGNALGFAVGTLIWATCALVGLALVFEALPWLYATMKIAGAGFLIFLAWKVWRGSSETVRWSSDDTVSVPGFWRSVRLGLMTQLANPKVAIFFGSIFVAILPAKPSPALQFAAVAMVVSIEWLWYASMALALSTPRVQTLYARAKSRLDKVSALVLSMLGAALLLDSR